VQCECSADGGHENDVSKMDMNDKIDSKW
jgi:hypothetical protein